MSGRHRSLVVALFPWGDVIEEFLDPIGLTLEDFVERMTGGWLFGYAAALRSAGHRPVIVCVSRQRSEITRYTHAGTGTPIWIAPGQAPRQGRSAVGYSLRRWAATPLAAFREILTRLRCDVVLTQEYEYTRFDALAWLTWRMKIPLFATFQGGDRTLSWVEGVVRQASLRSCRGLIVASAGERTRLAETYPRLSLNLADIANPIEPAEWKAIDREEARAALGLRGETFIAINHGRIDVQRKGLDVLLQAWAPFAQDTAAELVIIGSGQDHDLFARLLSESGLRNVRWLSNYTTDRGLIRRWLSAADVYVTASRVEGMPVAPLEAMACGLPIVATDAQGLPDILAGGEASGGLMVRRDSPEDLAGALKRLREAPWLRAELAVAARRRVEEKFSISAVGACLDQLLTSR